MKKNELAELAISALEGDSWREWLSGTKSGAIGAVHFLALIFWALGGEVSDKEKRARIVDGWASELTDGTMRRCAVLGSHGPTREVIPRDPVSLLELRNLSPDWDWVLSIDDADSFLERRGMAFTCSGVLAHWYKEVWPDAQTSEVSELITSELERKAVMNWTPERRAQLLADFNAAPGKTVKERRANLTKKWQTGDANLKKYLALAKKDAEASKHGSPWAALQKTTR